MRGKKKGIRDSKSPNAIADSRDQSNIEVLRKKQPRTEDEEGFKEDSLEVNDISHNSHPGKFSTKIYFIVPVLSPPVKTLSSPAKSEVGSPLSSINDAPMMSSRSGRSKIKLIYLEKPKNPRHPDESGE